MFGRMAWGVERTDDDVADVDDTPVVYWLVGELDVGQTGGVYFCASECLDSPPGGIIIGVHVRLEDRSDAQAFFGGERNVVFGGQPAIQPMRYEAAAMGSLKS